MEEKLYSTAEVTKIYKCDEFIVVDEDNQKHFGRDLYNTIAIVESFYLKSVKEIYAGKWYTKDAVSRSMMLHYSYVKRKNLMEIPDLCIKFKATGLPCNIREFAWIRIYSVRNGPYETNENETLNYKPNV